MMKNEFNEKIVSDIREGRTSLGIELGSTRIKAVLIDSAFTPIATGSYEWENQLKDGIWTYSLEDVWEGVRRSYRNVACEVSKKYGETLTNIGSIGFSAMMHGYLAFDKNDELLVPFRTWRNSITKQSAEKLTDAFHYNIPQRWSIAHLYQAILNNEEHIKDIDFITTLAGYVHWQLTGNKVIGVGDGSGMFPIDIETKNYDQRMKGIFGSLIADKNLNIDLNNILPKVLLAGQPGGTLTQKGAKLLDDSGNLKPGIPICPPEGDAGTGMVATNSVGERTGNISAGTSAFAMIVLEKNLKNVYPEIDMVTTPSGDLVAMVHANNCSSDINAWVKIFDEFSHALGFDISKGEIFTKLFNEALKGDTDCGKLLSYGYLSGENITGVSEGRPLFVRLPDSNFNLANFMRLHIASAFGAMRIGMDTLAAEDVKVDKLVGHGGIFKTPQVAQRILAAAMKAPITVMETADEGGAWGISILASYMINKGDLSLEEFLDKKVFVGSKGVTITATEEELNGYDAFINMYRNGIAAEKAAIESIK